MCDNCLHPKEKIEVKETIHTVLVAIKELKEMFGIDYVVIAILNINIPIIIAHYVGKN
jgi:ATP-dependent DNA helicase RecQ